MGVRGLPTKRRNRRRRKDGCVPLRCLTDTTSTGVLCASKPGTDQSYGRLPASFFRLSA